MRRLLIISMPGIKSRIWISSSKAIFTRALMCHSDERIPAINIYRSSLGIGHSLSDTIDHISPEYFSVVGEFVIKFTSGIINVPILPFNRKVGIEMMKK